MRSRSSLLSAIRLLLFRSLLAACGTVVGVSETLVEVCETTLAGTIGTPVDDCDKLVLEMSLAGDKRGNDVAPPCN